MMCGMLGIVAHHLGYYATVKDRYGDEQINDSESSSSESEDDLEIVVDKDFYRTLSLLKKKDPVIYKKDVIFYKEPDDDDDDPAPGQSKAPKEKPMYLKDYERKVILEKEGKYEDEENSDGEEEIIQNERAQSPTYMDEQRQIRESFRKFVEDSDDDKEEEEGTTANLLTKRMKTEKEQEKEEEEYIAWLKGQKDVEDKDEVKEMSYLKQYWTDPKLDEGERFLRDYFLNKAYKESDDEEEEDDEECPPALEEAPNVSDSDGEEFLQKQSDFERKFNFRFEEPDSDLVKTFPRTIANSVRRKDDRRKRKREELKERKQKEKEKKQEELKQLKNLKRKELQEKLQKLRGLLGEQDLGVTEDDLLEDFDPDKYDKVMQKCFGDNFYGVEEQQKPQFEDDEVLEGDWNWDNWTGEEQQEDVENMEVEEREEEEDFAPHCDDPNFVMDAEYDPQAAPALSRKERKKKRLEREKNAKKKKKSKFAEVVSKQKPVFDPGDRSFQEYLEEYYKLDYEDMVDDLPCRFKYRQVVPCDFGLSTEEILVADDKDLNRWCSLRKTCMYRSDKEDIKDQTIYSHKGQNTWKKMQILKSLAQSNDDSEEPTTSKAKLGKKGRNKLKRRAVAETEDSASTTVSSPPPATEETVPENTTVIAEPAPEEAPADATPPAKKHKKQDSAAKTAETEEKADATPPAKKHKKQDSAAKTAETEEKADATPPAKKHKKTDSAAKTAETEEKADDVVPKEKRKKPKKKGGLLADKLEVGGQEFSGKRLQAYGLNPRKLKFKQLEKQKQEKKKKKKNKKKNKKSGGGAKAESSA
ncbi:protein KRI1 homolog isoform X2 [Engystomops pustulosus]|uniref:protein KRI1 homolog isoform X2 n=1 Tax=Engystomops pustulosus TaxID=76066 RepID=UPI003AFA5297